MKSPLFSIILPTYNRRTLLSRAVESVLLQDYSNWELIIVDDGSTDDTKEYVETIKHSGIRYLYQPNKGRSAARNFGIKKSKGAYICFLDSDDELLKNYISNFHNIIKNGQSTNVILSGVRLVDNNLTIKIIPHSEPQRLIIQCLEGCFNLMPFCFHSSLMINHQFDEMLYYGEDFNLFLPIVLNNNVSISINDTSIVHQHSNRTINKVFENTASGYQQLQKSILLTIDNNFTLLSKYIGPQKLSEIKKSKVRDYILTAAKYNFKEASKINKKQEITSISNLRLLLQRVKGLIQS